MKIIVFVVCFWRRRSVLGKVVSVLYEDVFIEGLEDFEEVVVYIEVVFEEGD